MGDFIITFFVSVLATTYANGWTEINRQQQPKRSVRRNEQENPRGGTLWGFRFAAWEIITFLSCLHFIIFSSKSQYSYECPFIAV